MAPSVGQHVEPGGHLPAAAGDILTALSSGILAGRVYRVLTKRL